MVDAALRPRPTFSTFLQSDTNAGGDGLTYYDYQRLLRSQKVAVLQDRQAKSHVPGYKKVVAPTTRRIFQLRPTRSPAAPCTVGTSSQDVKQVAFPKEHTFTDSNTTAHEVDTTVMSQKQTTDSIVNTQTNRKDRMHAQTERLSSISKPQRLVKSATARTQHRSWSGAGLPGVELQRPRTACSSKETEVQVSQLQVQGLKSSESDAGNKQFNVHVHCKHCTLSINHVTF